MGEEFSVLNKIELKWKMNKGSKKVGIVGKRRKQRPYESRNSHGEAKEIR